MKTIGVGVQEIRIQDEAGAFRVIYIAKLKDAVYVLHCFQKKTPKTSAQDIALASKRYDASYARCEMSKQRFKSVWDAIENTPGEAANMKARAELMRAIAEHVRSSGMTQAEAAKTLGVTQPRISDLMRGKVDVFSIDTLVNMLAAAEIKLEMQLKKAA